jgi:hypothetical protein
MLLGQLPEARGVQIEPFDPDPYLVGADPRPSVQAPRGLREDSRRLDHPRQPDWHRHNHHPPKKQRPQPPINRKSFVAIVSTP